MKALGIALLLMLAPSIATASSLIGDETVGDFRSWTEAIQAGYVAGWRAHGAVVGLRCATAVTTGEYIAAIKYDARFTTTDRLIKALLLLEVRNGCQVAER